MFNVYIYNFAYPNKLGNRSIQHAAPHLKLSGQETLTDCSCDWIRSVWL